MDKTAFLEEFTRHLAVGEPKRSEIIAEVKQHSTEKPNLGNPKELARSMNRVHLGFLYSFRRLLEFRLATWIIAEILASTGLFFLYTHLIANDQWDDRWNILFVPINDITAFVPLLFLTIGAYAIGRMHRRWWYLFAWIVLMALLQVMRDIYWTLIGTLYISSATATPWYVSELRDWLISYGLSAVAIMLLVSGKRMLVAKHPVIDVAAAFVIQGIGASFLLTLFTNTMSYTLSSTPSGLFGDWMYYHNISLSVVIGLVGAGIEWWRVQSTRHKTNVYE